MAVTFGTDEIKRETTQWTILPEKIIIDPELNGRHENTDVASLAADIYANQQHTPCLIRKNADGLPVLVYGHRRLRAVMYLNEHLLKPGEPPVELLCNYEKLTDEQAFRAAVTENHQREKVNDIDHCTNITVWRNRFKKSFAEIAGIYFPEAKTDKEKADALRWVEERASLVELAPEGVQAVRAGEAKITAAVELARLTENQQRVAIANAPKDVAGKKRIRVADVKAVKAGKVPTTKPKPVKASGPDPDDVPFEVPAPVTLVPLPSNPILAAAEIMARALDAWRTDATEKTERNLIGAHEAYRKIVPLKQAA